ncbi:hypothetical protein EYF80_016920 [Liparis tanakae]|uniref:Uncharacterized protein n=1 Tax=Liparis tanakae TaxID=230148 RepID=A0A4Z2I416_9TELE|nr:hypothetical protein EYF80_016920 [Liparis tanakae]
MERLEVLDVADRHGNGDDLVVPKFEARQSLEVLEADDLLDGTNVVGLQIQFLKVAQTEYCVGYALQLTVEKLQFGEIQYFLQAIQNQELCAIVMNDQLDEMRRQIRYVRRDLSRNLRNIGKFDMKAPEVVAEGIESSLFNFGRTVIEMQLLEV